MMIALSTLMDRVVARARGTQVEELPRGELDEFELAEIERAARLAQAIRDDDDWDDDMQDQHGVAV
jgi:hypothetical protein